jgi:hypothetical protein
MNQKVIIYIILSGLLLYLYYRTRDITIFASFIVVVTMTMFEHGVEKERDLKIVENAVVMVAHYAQI